MHDGADYWFALKPEAGFASKDDRSPKVGRAAQLKEWGAIERYSGIITNVCEPPITALSRKCSTAMQTLSSSLNTMHQGSINAIRNVRS